MFFIVARRAIIEISLLSEFNRFATQRSPVNRCIVLPFLLNISIGGLRRGGGKTSPARSVQSRAGNYSLKRRSVNKGGKKEETTKAQMKCSYRRSNMYLSVSVSLHPATPLPPPHPLSLSRPATPLCVTFSSDNGYRNYSQSI